jgi:DNA repair protein RecN (Recombination protein N)
MLRFLAVRHLAVIDQLEVEFAPGLNLITGETGAGKSVLIEAIDLLLGGRASADLVRTGEQAATVQAIFDRPDLGEVFVRREISAQGRSRAFIDDALATTGALRELGQTLVDLHGQHEHQTLLEPAGHILLLDAFLARASLSDEVQRHFARWRSTVTELGRSRLNAREKQERIDLAAFHLSEIDKTAPVDDEDLTLDAERTILANADRLGRLSEEAYAALYEGDVSALTGLAVVWKRLADLAALDAAFHPYLEQRDSIKSSLEDLAFFLRSYGSRLDGSPARLQAVEDRLAAIERLKRKYGPTLKDVLARQAALRDELAGLEASDERAATLATEELAARAAYLDQARALSAARTSAGARLSRSLETALADLAMPQARVEIRVVPADQPEDWGPDGIDRVEFFLSPNPGEELRPLARIASGGELSRVMLALHTLASPGAAGRTLVFDEVDAGIGGAAADAVGALLQALAVRYQVVCITHLPQVAARAGTHFQVSKRVAGGRTSTVLTPLDGPGRELEIARMIAGADVPAQVLGSARELLRARGESEPKPKGESADRAKAKGRPHGR